MTMVRMIHLRRQILMKIFRCWATHSTLYCVDEASLNVDSYLELFSITIFDGSTMASF